MPEFDVDRGIEEPGIPTCSILGVNIAAINMKWLVAYLVAHKRDTDGDFICVANVHSTVMAYRDREYCKIQNSGLMAIPDGGPLSKVARMRGHRDAQRTAGPDLMHEIFSISAVHGYRHYFYGSTEETLRLLDEALCKRYPGLQIAGMYSPPFQPLMKDEDEAVIQTINESTPDFIWVGLGAPKQERWMSAHKGKFEGLMIGVGAGFDYFAGNITRAPQWMQKNNLEWLHRLLQDPKRLFMRYFTTNIQFIWHAIILGK